MSFQPSNSYAPFLPTTVVLPYDQNERLVRTTQLFNDIALRLNNREIASYETVELITGQSWFSDVANPNTKRFTFRKVFSIASLTAPGTTTVAHGLGAVSGFIFTRIYGTAQNSSGTLFIPLPQATPDDVAITIDSTNINIIAATGTYSGFSALVVLEYLKN